MLGQAAKFFCVKEKELQPFTMPDTFNDDLPLEGFICHRQDYRYGAVYFTAMGGHPCKPQVIWGSPKMHYPFDKNGRYIWPDVNKLNVYEKLDGCFTYRTRILLADGTTEYIGKIVNQHQTPLVWSYNCSTKQVVQARVLKGHRFPRSKPMISIRIASPPFFRTRQVISCTEDHRIMTPRGWKKAGCLKPGDKVERLQLMAGSSLMYEFLTGCLLGDSYVGYASSTKNSQKIYAMPAIYFRHCDAQHEYLNLKYKLMSNFCSSAKPRSCKGGFDTDQWQFQTRTSVAFDSIFKLFRPKNVSKQIPSNIGDYLTPMALAVFYMDDGSYAPTTIKQRSRVMFHTQGFKENEVRGLLNALTKKYNITGRIGNYGKGPQIEVTASGTARLFSIIAPYIPTCMHYKIPPAYRVTFSYLDQINPFPAYSQLVTCKVLSVSPFHGEGASTDNFVYDLTVENTSSYFVNGGVLVHNSNVVSYVYTYQDKKYVTYKLRLSPILRSGKFGDFRSMWEEMLLKYPQIPEATLKAGMNLSFELWGARNKHLIAYTVPLDICLLFGIKGTVLPEIVDPDDIPVTLPLPTKKTLHLGHEVTSFYKTLQAETEATNKVLDIGIEGSEGWVFYCHTASKVTQWKCKPETIEKIHWASGGIGKNSIKATCQNAFEQSDDPSLELVKQLLREEFTEKNIEEKSSLILKILLEVKEEKHLEAAVMEKYKALGITLVENKAAVMRKMSEFFPKHKIGYVYWIVAHSGV